MKSPWDRATFVVLLSVALLIVSSPGRCSTRPSQISPRSPMRSAANALLCEAMDRAYRGLVGT
jgi:hypothetical protein